MKIRLYTTLYNEKKTLRKQELLSCLDLNCENAGIDSIIILNEGGLLQSLKYDKIIEIPISQRPTFNDFIQLINSQAQNNDIHIIANTDIYFDRNIGVLKQLDLIHTCLALSRWETSDKGRPVLYDHNDSQDVWVFKGKIKSTLNADFPLGVPRCDNRFMYELEQAGYRVLNPAYSIKAYHLHTGQQDVVYTEGDNQYNIQPPFRYKYPHNLYGFWKTTWHNMTNTYQLGRYRFDIKKLNSWLPVRFARKTVEFITKKKLPLIGYH